MEVRPRAEIKRVSSLSVRGACMLAGFESERARGRGDADRGAAIASIRYVVPFDPGTVNGNDTSYRDRPGRHDTVAIRHCRLRAARRHAGAAVRG